MLQVMYFVIAAVLVGIDQLTKLWAASRLNSPAGPIALIPGVFELRYCENRGVAFSLLEGQRWLFIPLTLLTSALIVLILLRSTQRHRFLFSFSCSLVLAGGIGNLIDRIAYGYVIDFLYVKLIDFPIFNFADCCVVVGAFLLFGFLLFGLKGEEDTPLRTLLLGIPVRAKEKKDG
ncbi:MAG: signal peptidase II [Clostridia bacterium]|nr:signal peptidase II [Clostridia bacterium]